jgi:hypothetical protein
MRSLRNLLGMTLLMANLHAQIQSKHRDPSLGLNRQPVLYVVAAGPRSEKFSRQIGLLSRRSDIATALDLFIVPDTTTFLAMGWPLSLSIKMPDQRPREAVTKRFGSIEGKQGYSSCSLINAVAQER